MRFYERFVEDKVESLVQSQIVNTETLLEALAELKLPEGDYVYNIVTNTFMFLSKTDNKITEYTPTAFVDQAREVWNRYSPCNFQLTFDRKQAPSMFKEALVNVSDVTCNLAMKPGIYYENGKKIWNHWTPSPVMKKISDEIEGKDKIPYELLDFDKYPFMMFLLKAICSPEINKPKDKFGREYCPIHYTLNWSAAALQWVEKLGVALILQSTQQGSGKTAFFENVF